MGEVIDSPYKEGQAQICMLGILSPVFIYECMFVIPLACHFEFALYAFADF